MKKGFLFFLLIIAFVACQPGRKEMLTGKWQADSLVNPQMDSIIAEAQNFIDNVGNTDSGTIMETYGTFNIDSITQAKQLELDTVKLLQLEMVRNTLFDLRRDGTATLNFSGNENPAKWELAGNDDLLFREPNDTGTEDTVKMHIEALTQTRLKLKFEENGSVSTVTFHHTEK